MVPGPIVFPPWFSATALAPVTAMVIMIVLPPDSPIQVPAKSTVNVLPPPQVQQAWSAFKPFHAWLLPYMEHLGPAASYQSQSKLAPRPSRQKASPLGTTSTHPTCCSIRFFSLLFFSLLLFIHGLRCFVCGPVRALCASFNFARETFRRLSGVASFKCAGASLLASARRLPPKPWKSVSPRWRESGPCHPLMFLFNAFMRMVASTWSRALPRL
mmetsp:Transcript_127025/g.230638  ORF Transcript_127025/g.230638 Transcript_127025/m.230638 type:complete len:214 (-) Transcript_127025:3652-4293(-)